MPVVDDEATPFVYSQGLLICVPRFTDNFFPRHTPHVRVREGTVFFSILKLMVGRAVPRDVPETGRTQTLAAIPRKLGMGQCP